MMHVYYRIESWHREAWSWMVSIREDIAKEAPILQCYEEHMPFNHHDDSGAL